MRTCDCATINDLRHYLPDHMCKKYKQGVWLNLILWLIQFENSFRSGQMIYGLPDTYILQNIIHRGVWCMVGFWHWHIPTFIITDISPPWWDFVMVGMCWVTMINPQILLPSAIFVDCRRQASELQKEQPIQALRSAWRLFKKNCCQQK